MAMLKKTPPKRRAYSEYRSREYLLLDEINALEKAARSKGRNQLRDVAIIRTLYRHALRVGELIHLDWSQISLTNRTLHVLREKNGRPSVHSLQPEEIRAFRNLLKVYQYPHVNDTPVGAVFLTELNQPLTNRTVHRIVSSAGVAAGIPFIVHPHMLRHSKGYNLVNRGEDIRAIQQYFGHRRIENTVMYTHLQTERLKGFEKDY